MEKIEKSERIRSIEEKWGSSIKSLFHSWHWEENLTHREIAEKIGVPRPTVTRWFRQFEIPSQSYDRMTKRRWQIRLVKALKQIKKRRFVTDPPCLANKHFFKKWTPEMAYALGYFAADGCMFVNCRGSHYIHFCSTDRELIENVKQAMNSSHSVAVRKSNNPEWKTKYRLQIGSKEMFDDLLRFGFTPNKSKAITLPFIPKKLLSDFVRGYFDGDGCVHYGFYLRNNRSRKSFILLTTFTSGSKQFLQGLWSLLGEVGLRGGCLKKKERGFELCFSIKDSKRLYDFIYGGISTSYFLERKYNKFQTAFQIMGI